MASADVYKGEKEPEDKPEIVSQEEIIKTNFQKFRDYIAKRIDWKDLLFYKHFTSMCLS